jgi:hypothetical protein
MSRKLLIPLLLATMVFLGASQGRKYNGPRPPKPDIPYLLHADTLIETEVREAKEDSRQNEATYTIPGASSPAKTPLAEPIFLLQVSKLSPDSLQCYRLESKGGNRQAFFSKKKRKDASHQIRFTITRLEEDLYRLEANQTLENGEYCLSPSGSNQVFCFQVY